MRRSKARLCGTGRSDGDESYRGQLLRGGGGSLVLKAVQIVLLLSISVLLARTLGADGYGVYAYAFALVELLGLPAQAGVQTLVVREVARFRQEEQWARLRGILGFSVVAVLVVTVAIALVVGLITWLQADGSWDVADATLLWALLLLPVVSLLQLFGASLRGLKSIVRGLLPQSLVQPGGFLLLCVLTLWFAARLSPDRAMLLHVLAATVGMAVAAGLLVRAVPRPAKEAATELELRAWIASAFPLTLITGMQVINSRADLVMLGWFGSAGDVGVYRVVVDSSLLVLFGLKAINTAVAPHFSALWTAEDRRRLQRLVTIAARVSLGFALPLGLVLLLFGKPILSIVFGAEYASGHVALAITVGGQIINAAFGSIALLLNMTGNEMTVVRGLAVAALCNVGLNLVLIPMWGLEGAAIATVVTLALWNASLWWAGRGRIGIDTFALRRLVGADHERRR